jgi:3-isopropylmalate/(R)-2-methylmalate dehydratase large subunit
VSLVSSFGRVLHLAADPGLVRAQLAGQDLAPEAAGPLRDDVSTDEISPLAAMVHFDAALGRHAHTGFTAGGQRPIGLGALQAAGIGVLVGGRRYGKGSSREHAPLAELSAGVRLVVAESFERIYRDNADNLGLLTSTDLTLPGRLQRGGTVTLDELLADRPPQAAAIVRAGGLLRWQPAPGDAPPPGDRRPQTLFDKIVERHRAGAGLVRPDWRFIHEYYTGMAAHLLALAFGEGVQLHGPRSIVCFEDHLTLAHRSPLHLAQGLLPGARRLGQVHREFVARHGLVDHGVHADGEGSQGISHALMAERYARPGQLLVGTDSHTPHSGALGCIAFGVGTTEMARAFVSGSVRLGRPEVLRVQVAGRLPAGVSAKDLALHLLATPRLREGGGVGRVFEFGGPAVRAMTTDERATLTNMTAEMGGLAGYVEPDAETLRFIAERRGEALSLEPWMRSDPGAPYAEVLTVDASSLSPWVARPGDPGRGLPLSALPERPAIHIAYGGSCTAGKRADFEAYHAVAAWAAAHGLRVADGVQLFLQFGTDEVRAHAEAAGWCSAFEVVGATLLPPGCGACANGGPGASTQPGQVTVSAINRNFPGRSGPGQVWLASPATVAASAIAGRLQSFEELRARHRADG